jgi:hypothetical protein
MLPENQKLITLSQVAREKRKVGWFEHRKATPSCARVLVRAHTNDLVLETGGFSSLFGNWVLIFCEEFEGFSSEFYLANVWLQYIQYFLPN